MSTVIEKISAFGIIPVVVLEDAKDAAPLAKALVDGISLEESIRLANAVGALTVTRHGAVPSLPTREEVESFIQSRTRF